MLILIFQSFFFENRVIVDKNVFLPFHVFTCVFKNKWLFIQKTMRVFLSKVNKKLDSQILALKMPFNQITLKLPL